MKKIITLLLMTCSFAAVHAQTKKEEARNVVLNGSKKSSGSGSTASTGSNNGRDVVLGSDGNTRVRRYPAGTYNKKMYGKKKGTWKKPHTDNGKHKGWEKGKGNQHKVHGKKS